MKDRVRNLASDMGFLRLYNLTVSGPINVLATDINMGVSESNRHNFMFFISI